MLPIPTDMKNYPSSLPKKNYPSFSTSRLRTSRIRKGNKNKKIINIGRFLNRQTHSKSTVTNKLKWLKVCSNKKRQENGSSPVI